MVTEELVTRAARVLLFWDQLKSQPGLAGIQVQHAIKEFELLAVTPLRNALDDHWAGAPTAQAKQERTRAVVEAAQAACLSRPMTWPEMDELRRALVALLEGV